MMMKKGYKRSLFGMYKPRRKRLNPLKITALTRKRKKRG